MERKYGKMKLIIDIDDKDYEKLKDGHIPFRILDVIQNGIPLEQMRSEIEQIADEEQKHDKKWAIGLRYALKIIDKYR